MEFFNLLKQESETPSRRLIIIAGFVGVFNGLLLSAILGAAVTVSQGDDPHLIELGLFSLFLLLWILSRKYVMDQASIAVETILRKVRIRISKKVSQSSVLGLEILGQAPIQTILGQETQKISLAASNVIGALSSAILSGVALLYILTISTLAFYLITLSLIAAAGHFLSRVRVVQKEMRIIARMESEFFDRVSHLLDGFKELKLDNAKTVDLLDNDIRVIAERNEKMSIKAELKMNWLGLYGQAYFYVLIGMIIFMIPSISNPDPVQITKTVTIVLFLIGPLSEVVGAMPPLARANAAIQTLRQLEEELESVDRDVALTTPQAPNEPFESLRCEGLIFRYPEMDGTKGFQLGPVDLEIKRGELVFLVGGNGSGKSTLLKALTGLYPVTEGQILINGKKVTPSQITAYRNNFSMILQDFHLFHRLLGHKEIDFTRVAELLSLLQMDHITGVAEDGKFERINLSTGQKKRLALMVVELDNRDVFIFDEWAADQDPSFRLFFYRTFLPLLISKGKTIIAATHDDHYFDVADRVLKMSEGRIESYQAGGIESLQGPE